MGTVRRPDCDQRASVRTQPGNGQKAASPIAGQMRASAWKATLRNEDGVADALLAWAEHGDKLVAEGERRMGDILVHPGRLTEQLPHTADAADAQPGSTSCTTANRSSKSATTQPSSATSTSSDSFRGRVPLKPGALLSRRRPSSGCRDAPLPTPSRTSTHSCSATDTTRCQRDCRTCSRRASLPAFVT